MCVLANSHIVGAVMSADTLTEFRVIRITTIKEDAYIEAYNWEDVGEKIHENEFEWQRLEDHSTVEVEET